MLSHLRDFPDSEFHSSIVLKKTDFGFHTGIIYRNLDEESVDILHLAFHIQLENDSLTNLGLWNYNDFWVIPIDFEPSFQRTLSAYCSTILERNKNGVIMYGLLSGDSKFIRDGTLILGENCSGLSCSSFVIAVFNSIGIKLIDINTWPKRDSDIKDHNQLLKFLKGKCESLGHMNHYYTVEKEVGCSRVRPSETTATLRFAEKPAGHEEIIKLGELIAQEVINNKVS